MPQHVPVPAQISILLEKRKIGSFPIYPLVTITGDGLEIIGWTARDRNDNDRGLYDILALSVLPRALLNDICRMTFENEKTPAVMVGFQIGDELWEMPMRAVEKEHESVHYEIEIDGERMEMLETYLGDIIHDDMALFAENEVSGSIDFGNMEAVYQQMA